jgi:hypothetical protein
MTLIEVMVIRTDADGTAHTYWGGETGTPEFYTVKHTLEAYLNKNVLIYHHDMNDTFVIEETDRGCINESIKIIEGIYDNNYVFKKRGHISFKIINVE